MLLLTLLLHNQVKVLVVLTNTDHIVVTNYSPSRYRPLLTARHMFLPFDIFVRHYNFNEKWGIRFHFYKVNVFLTIHAFKAYMPHPERSVMKLLYFSYKVLTFNICATNLFSLMIQFILDGHLALFG